MFHVLLLSLSSLRRRNNNDSLLLLCTVLVFQKFTFGFGYDCSIGCPLTVNTKTNGTVALVCGNDGIYYMNDCIALCQNVSIATSDLPCLLGVASHPQELLIAHTEGTNNNNSSTASSILLSASKQAKLRKRLSYQENIQYLDTSSAATVLIPLDKIYQFHNEDFKLKRKIDFTKIVSLNPYRKHYNRNELQVDPIDGTIIMNQRQYTKQQKKKKQQQQRSSYSSSPLQEQQSLSGHNEESSGGSTTADAITEYQALRITSEGYEYTTDRIQVTQQSSSLTSLLYERNQIPQSTDGYIPENLRNEQKRNLQKEEDQSSIEQHDLNESVEEGRNNNTTPRKLIVIGDDTRSPITNTRRYPYSAVVSLGYTDCEGCCSGTVISNTSVITAAHCVFDIDKAVWDTHTFVVPGRNGWDVQPFGRWYVDYITIYRTWKNNNNDPDYDIAVVKYKPNQSKQSIGNVVGYVGIAEVDSKKLTSDTNLQQSTITGYPDDKPLQMWTSGTCPTNNREVSRVARYLPIPDYLFLIEYLCDTKSGMSGSSILGPDNKIRGIHTFGSDKDEVNGGVAFLSSSPHYNTILKWSGLTLPTGPSSSPTVSPTSKLTCPCKPNERLCLYFNSNRCS